MHRELKTLPWNDIPAVDVTYDKGHARIESRTLKLTEVAAGIGLPRAPWPSRSPDAAGH